MSHIFALTIYFKLIKFFFQIFPLSVRESSFGFVSYIVQIITVSLTWILQESQSDLLPMV